MKSSLATAGTLPMLSVDTAEAVLQPPFPAIDRPVVEIVLPVHNEAHILETQVTKLVDYLAARLPYRYQITIADNGSTDETLRAAAELAQSLKHVRVVATKEAGRGRALKQVWQSSSADILAYMDIDLSTGLDDFLPLVEPLVRGEAGVAIGTRLHKQSQTTRGVKREIISRTYNRIIKWSTGIHVSDAQCGFKAVRRDVAEKLLRWVRDNEWFFDTELLIKAERSGVPIHEQPVSWIEDKDSRVKIVRTAVDDLKGLHRVNKELDKRSALERLTLPVLLTLTGALYLFGAMQNGMANSYYAAAVQAASQNWTAWLFGSLDGANYVSVDKPPLATMVMGLSARIFGFSSFSMLLPNILAGVASVWLLYAIVRRHFGLKSAVIAGTTLALTPVATLMFGFNNPDALLTCMLTASAYTFLRSLEGKRPLLWLGLAGLFTGLAFNTKMLQGMMVLPAMVIVYLAFAKPPVVTRALHVLFAGVVTAISTFWWSVLVWLTPAGQRPWVGSTSDNSIWSLIFGYNGFGRLFGGGMGQGGMPGGGGGFGGSDPSAGQGAMGLSGSNAAAGGSFTPPSGMGDGGMGMGAGGPGGGGGGPGGSGFGGQTSIVRMWNGDFGPNIGWLLLFALVGGGVMLWILRKTPRTNIARAATVFWLLWLLIHIVIFSMTSGVIHPYYVVVMAPAVAALVGISVPFLWAAYQRHKPYAVVLPLLVVATSVIAIALLRGGSLSWLGWIVGLSGMAGTIGLMIHLYQPNRRLVTIGATAAIVACTISPIAFAASTVTQTHTGSIPTAGPSATAMSGSNNESSQADSSLVRYLLQHQGDATWIVAVASANESAAIQLTSGQPVMAVGGFNGSDTPLTLAQFKQLVSSGKLNYYAVSSRGSRGGGGPGGGNTEISTWVTSHGTKVNYGGNSDVTLYALSV